LLGAGHPPQGGICQGRDSHAAGDTRRAVHQVAYPAVYLHIVRGQSVALCDSHEWHAVSGRSCGAGPALYRLGLGSVSRQPKTCGDQDLQVFTVVPAVAVRCPAGGSLRGSNRMALSGVQKTVLVTVAAIALVVGLTVNKVLRPAPLSRAELQSAWVYIIYAPRH